MGIFILQTTMFSAIGEMQKEIDLPGIGGRQSRHGAWLAGWLGGWAGVKEDSKRRFLCYYLAA